MKKEINLDAVYKTVRRLRNTDKAIQFQNLEDFKGKAIIAISKQKTEEHVYNKRDFYCLVRKELGACRGEYNHFCRDCKNCAAAQEVELTLEHLAAKQSSIAYKQSCLRRLQRLGTPCMKNTSSQL